MDNQYNYNTPNDQFQNQATGNGGPDFHFGQTDPDFSHRKKEKKPRDHKKVAKIAGGLCFAVAFGVIASAAFQTTNFVGNALFGEKVKTEKSSEKKVDSTSLTRTSSTVTSDVSEVVNSVMPSVVSITNMSVQQVQSFFGGTSSQEVQSSGSGIIVGQNDTELLIATNNHVVEGSTTLTVSFINESSAEAKIKGTDASRDLAVIAVPLENIEEETMGEIKVATLGDSTKLQVGEPVIAIGNALGYGQSVTTGIVSALNRQIDMEGFDAELIQTDAAINPGNSGGALVNANGEVIGINTVKVSSDAVEGMGYAIPISDANETITTLMNKETREQVPEDERGFLGVEITNVEAESAELYGMPTGVYIRNVIEGTGAEKAGLVRGGVIAELDGSSVDSMTTLQNLLSYYRVGETVTLTVEMPGKDGSYEEKEVEVVLSEKQTETAIPKR
jgi:S1-C subfamily serine protease